MTTTALTLPRLFQPAWLRPFPFLAPDPSAARLEKQLERRRRRASRRREPLVLGTLEQPWDPLTELSFATLHELLRERRPLALEIVCRSPRLLHDARLLADLDQRHAVRVDVPHAGEGHDGGTLALVRALGERGVAARLVVTAWRGEDDARRVLSAARDALATDVCLRRARPDVDGVESERAFARLRLEHGFPRALPGRG